MSLWGRAFAALYDRMLAASERNGLAQRRRELLSSATGSVIEIGAGTGANLAQYPGDLQRLVLLEPEGPMARRLAARLGRSGLPAEVVRAPAEAIPFADGSFDTAVCTLVLCTVSDPAAALTEIGRVLRPDGRLLFLEHVRAEDPALARRQDLLAPIWVRLGHGCRCNRRTAEAIEAAGFRVERIERGRIPKASSITRPMIVGRAAAPASAAGGDAGEM